MPHQSPAVRGRVPWGLKTYRRLNLQWLGQRPRVSTISCRQPGPQNCPLLVIHTLLIGTGWHHPPQFQTHQPKSTRGVNQNRGSHHCLPTNLLHPLFLMRWCPSMLMWVTPSGSAAAGLRDALRTLNLPCHYMQPCVQWPPGYKTVMSLCSTTFLMLMPWSSMTNGHTKPFLHVPTDVETVVIMTCFSFFF